jgi:glycosyltransferase involved in cell wall biosynthesis
MKITIITPRFAISGVPLAQIRFARAWSARGHDVRLIIGKVEAGYEVPSVPGVVVEHLNKSKVREMLVPLIRHLRKEKPDILFSAEDHLNAMALIAALISGSKVKTSGSSRVLPTDRLAYSDKPLSKGWLLKNVMKALMWRADALTCVSQDMVGMYQKMFRNSPHVCVYNIIKDEASLAKAKEPVEHPWLSNKSLPVVISAGTLTRRKGFADLINAFAIAQASTPMRLIILGDGYLMDELTSLARELGIEDKVSLPGNVLNPLKYFSRANVFVLSSYAEGMPNVLVEAMMCGCTPVATDCPTGPRELLDDGRIGFLLPMGDVASMADAILKAVQAPTSPAVLAKAVMPFEDSAVLDSHLRVLGLTDKDVSFVIGQ